MVRDKMQVKRSEARRDVVLFAAFVGIMPITRHIFVGEKLS
jgi:hypothetical protein